MAFLAFQEIGGAAVARRTHDVPAMPVPAAEAAPAPTRFAALEWSVIALARKDRLSSIDHPNRIGRALRALFKQHNPMLADPRLEALRRMAVLSWHYGYTVPSHEIRAFLTAGFNADQYETMVDGIAVARAATAAR